MSYTKQNTRVESTASRTNFNDAGVALAVEFAAQLRTRVANDQVPSEIADLAIKNVSFDLIGSPVGTTNYTAAGKTVSGVQLAALIRQVVLDEATRQGI